MTAEEILARLPRQAKDADTYGLRVDVIEIVRDAVTEERERCLKAVRDEEELDGDIPAEMWDHARRDPAGCLRATVRATKKGIEGRIRQS